MNDRDAFREQAERWYATWLRRNRPGVRWVVESREGEPDWAGAAQRLDDYLAKRPIAGPYLLKADEYPFTVALFVASNPDRLVWALSVLKPTHGLMRALEIPPAAQWVGERLEAVTFPPPEWPERWTSCG